VSRRTCILGAFIIWIVAIFTMSGEGRQAGRQGKSERENADVEKLLNESDCHSCHAIDRKVVGPSYTEIARRYSPQRAASNDLVRTIREGGSGQWGAVPMPAHPDLKDVQLAEIVSWILSLDNSAFGPPLQEATTKQYTYTVDGKKVTVDFPVFVEGNDKRVTKDIFRGYQLYNSYCYRCHGTDATTSESAPDGRRFVEAGAAVQDFMSVAMAGREDKGMPSWAGFLSEEEVQQIYKYVKGRSLELVPSGRPPSEFD